MTDFLTDEVLINAIVQPDDPIFDYKTDFTGVTKGLLEEAVATGQILKGIRGAQAAIFEHTDANTIVVGWSAFNELATLRLAEKRIFDPQLFIRKQKQDACSWLTEERERVRLPKLVHEAANEGIVIQAGDSHDSLEDTFATSEISRRILTATTNIDMCRRRQSALDACRVAGIDMHQRLLERRPPVDMPARGSRDWAKKNWEVFTRTKRDIYVQPL